MELTAVQIFIVGVFASLITVGLRFVSVKYGYTPSKAVLTIAVGVVSFILAVLFNVPSLPVCTDAMECANMWIALISAYVGFATIIYNVLLDKVLKSVVPKNILKG